jgi:hypothetical protein
MPQLASAVLAIVFAATMLITGQLFIKSRSATTFIIPQAQAFPHQVPVPRGVKQSRATQFSVYDQRF